MSDQFPDHVALPLDTHAFICAKCGAVALDPNKICVMQGKITKGDWCGSKSIEMPLTCKHDKNIIRYKCTKCGRVAINPELLCEPEKIPEPENM